MPTPDSGVPSRCVTFPRRTAARIATMVPGATPAWMGLEPAYRKAVEVERSVNWVGLTVGATVFGSGGMNVVDVVLVVGVVAIVVEDELVVVTANVVLVVELPGPVVEVVVGGQTKIRASH